MQIFSSVKKFLYTASHSSACHRTATITSATKKVSQTFISKKPPLEMPDFQAPFIASIDNGTTSTRFIVFDSNGRIVQVAQKEYPQYYPKAGWVEHDLEEIFIFTKECMESVVEKMQEKGLDPLNSIKGIGITNQRETTCVWDKKTGKPLHKALVWLDTRTKDLVHDLVEKTPTKSANFFQEKCGLPLSTYFSAVKLKWLLDNVDCVRDAANQNQLAFGTVDSWLLYKFTGGAGRGIHATDVTNASRTMLMNLSTLKWDQEILDFFSISSSMLPEIKSSSEIYGRLAPELVLAGIPICGILGDQQAALVGQLCLQKGQLKNTYGTGCFMLCNTGTSPVISQHGLLTTVGYQLGPNQPCHYALEGSIAIAGASVKWLRDNLGLIQESKQVGELADKVSSSDGVYFVPAFSGLFAPHWRDDARGTVVGMTLHTTKEHICRAVLEAVSFQTKDIMDSMSLDMKNPITLIRVDGGMTASNQLMQIQADIGGVEIDRPVMLETTALGAALAAGLAVQVWPSLDSFANEKSAERFSPKIGAEKRDKMKKGWDLAIQKSFMK